MIRLLMYALLPAVVAVELAAELAIGLVLLPFEVLEELKWITRP